MTQTATAYATWHTNPNDDAAMARSHAPLTVEVSVRRFGYEGLAHVPKDRRYYPSILDALAAPAEHKLLFRLEKRG